LSGVRAGSEKFLRRTGTRKPQDRLESARPKIDRNYTGARAAREEKIDLRGTNVEREFKSQSYQKKEGRSKTSRIASNLDKRQGSARKKVWEMLDWKSSSRGGAQKGK